MGRPALYRREKTSLSGWNVVTVGTGHSNSENGTKPGLEIREIEMVGDDEDLPVAYLLYAVVVIVVIAALAISTFLLFFR